MAVKRYNGTSWDTVAGLGAQGANAISSSITTWVKTAAGGETSLTGSSDSSTTLAYTPGQEQLFINGVLQVRGVDYTATNGTSITGISALIAGDVATVTTVNAFSVTGAVPLSTVTANGDLIVGTGPGAVGRLGVGSTGQVLTVSGGVPTWATPTTPPTPLAPFLVAPVSQYYVSNDDAWGSQAGFQQNQVQYTPVYLPAATYDRIAIRSGASHSGTSTVRLGLYNVGSDGRPSTVAFDAGTVSVNAASTNFLITINQTLTAGYYYLAGVNQSANNTFIAYGSGDSPPSVRIGTGLNANYFTAFHQTGVSGAFGTAANLVSSADCFGLAIRIA